MLDTNVLIAAFASRGLCADLFELCLAQHDLFTSVAIMDELERNLCKKLKVPTGGASDIRAYLESEMEVVVPVKVAASMCRDKNDLVVLGTARAAHADVLISGDADLTAVKSQMDYKIMSPRAFWESLTK